MSKPRPHHRPRLVSRRRPSRRAQTLQAQPRPHHAFAPAVVLFNTVVAVLARAQPGDTPPPAVHGSVEGRIAWSAAGGGPAVTVTCEPRDPTHIRGMEQDTAAAVRSSQDRSPSLAARRRPAGTPPHRRERPLAPMVIGSALLHLLLAGLLLSPTWDRGDRTPPEPLPLRGIDVVFESAPSSAPSLPGSQSETSSPTPGPPSPEALPETPEALPETPSEPAPATPEVAGSIAAQDPPAPPPPAPAPASAQLASPSTGERLSFQANAPPAPPAEAASPPGFRLTPPPDEPFGAALAAPVPVRPAPVSRPPAPSPTPSRTEAPRRPRSGPASGVDEARPKPVGPQRQGPADRATGTARLGGEGRGSFAEARSNDVGADWLNALSAWLQEHGSYPGQAAANGDEGTVAVRFVVDRSGRVMTVQLRQTTGSPWLNMAPPAWLRGAQLPPLPPTTTQPQATVDLTVHFLLIR